MTRHINNLARLHKKMMVRYGEDDPLVQDLKRELEEAMQAKPARVEAMQQAPVSYGLAAPFARGRDTRSRSLTAAN